jgi:sarcosine oxidase subunit beta
MNRRCDVAIVGAGIAGASLAFFLAERGLKVIVLERGAPASGGTGLSAAIVRQHYSTLLMARLALRSVDIFSDAPVRLGRDAGYRAVGYYFLTPPDALERTRENVRMQQEVGIETSMIEADELAARMPWLNPEGVAAAAHEPRSGFADPVTATNAFLDAAVERGAELRTRTPVRALLRSGAAITGVATDEDEIEAAWVVNAAGPWAAPLAASGGLGMSMRTVREQDTIWEARPDRPIPAQSVSNAVDAIYIRPLGERRFVIGRGFPKVYTDVDPYNYKLTAESDFVQDVQTRMTHRVPGLAGARLVHSYAALYDVTADWYPYVGPRRDVPGYADFCGGSGHGFKIAPAIAEELAGWLATGTAAPDFAALSHDRVADGRLFVQSYGGNRG